MPGDRGERNTSPLIFFYAVIGILLAFDQFTKFLALTRLSYYDSVPVIENIFHLTLVENKGVAFGLFRDYPFILTGIISLSLILLLVWFHRSRSMTTGMRWAMALIIGGALGNWVDRIRIGAVVDFLDFRVWPVFNFADCAISVGVGIYLLGVFFESRKKPHPSS